jgi:hypothetical protein
MTFTAGLLFQFGFYFHGLIPLVANTSVLKVYYSINNECFAIKRHSLMAKLRLIHKQLTPTLDVSAVNNFRIDPRGYAVHSLNYLNMNL